MATGTTNTAQNPYTSTSTGFKAATAAGGIGADQYLTNIKNWANANNTATDAAVADEMDKWGVSAQDYAQAIGGNAGLIQSKYDAVRNKSAATPPASTTPANTPTTTQPVVTPVTTPATTPASTTATTPQSPTLTGTQKVDLSQPAWKDTMKSFASSISGMTPDAAYNFYKGEQEAFGWTDDQFKAATGFDPSTLKAPASSGIINGASPSAAAVSTYTPEKVNMDGTMTVQDRMQSLIDPNSAMNQSILAGQKGIYNDRGLINSSMMASGAQDAIIKNAQGIATTDAGTAKDIALANQNAGNQAGQFNAGAQNTANLQAQQQVNTQSNMALQQSYDMTKLSSTQQHDLDVMATQYGYDLTKMDKQAVITLGQMDKQQQYAVANMATAFGYDMQKMSATQINDLAKMATTQSYVRENMATQQNFDITKMDKQAAATLSQMNLQQQHTVSNLATQFGYDMQKLSTNQINALAQLDKNATISEKLATLNIDAQKALNISTQQFTKLMTGSTQMQGIMTNLQNQVRAIQMDPNITDGTAKDNAVKAAADISRAALAVVGHASDDVDWTSLMDQLFPKK